MEVDAGPRQSPVSSMITEEQVPFAELSWAAKFSQAVAAFRSGAAPGPAYIKPELISGGKVPKSIWPRPYPAAIALATSVAAYAPALARSVVTNIP